MRNTSPIVYYHSKKQSKQKRMRPEAIDQCKKKLRHLEIESRANPWKGLMLPLHQWRASAERRVLLLYNRCLQKSNRNSTKSQPPPAAFLHVTKNKSMQTRSTCRSNLPPPIVPTSLLVSIYFVSSSSHLHPAAPSMHNTDAEPSDTNARPAARRAGSCCRCCADSMACLPHHWQVVVAVHLSLVS